MYLNIEKMTILCSTARHVLRYFLRTKLPATSAFVFLLHCTGNSDANYQVKQYNYTEDFFG